MINRMIGIFEVDMLHKLNYRALSFFVLLALGGCGGESTQSESLAAESQEDVVEKHEVHSVGHQSPVQGKPGANVSFRENIVHQLQPGVEADVTLALSSSHASGEMSIELATTENLVLIEGQTSYQFTLDEQGDYLIPLRLMAMQEGRHYVKLQVRVKHEGRETFKSLAAIVQVGDLRDSDRTGGAQEKATNSVDVISLPAQETINRE